MLGRVWMSNQSKVMKGIANAGRRMTKQNASKNANNGSAKPEQTEVFSEEAFQDLWTRCEVMPSHSDLPRATTRLP